MSCVAGSTFTQDQASCLTCTDCGGEVETTPCSTSSDTVCGECSTCRAGQYTLRPCENGKDTACSACITAQDCADGQYLSGNCDDPNAFSGPTCLSCATSCATCDGPDANQCLTCRPGSVRGEDGTCSTGCPPGQFQSSGSCAECDTTLCKTCSGSATQCTSCDGNRFLLEGTCVASCRSNNAYQVSGSTSCQRCTSCLAGQQITQPCTNQQVTCDCTQPF